MVYLQDSRCAIALPKIYGDDDDNENEIEVAGFGGRLPTNIWLHQKELILSVSSDWEWHSGKRCCVRNAETRAPRPPARPPVRFRP